MTQPTNKEHEYAIVTNVPEVGARRFSSEAEAKAVALETAERTGGSFTVVKVIGTAVCLKSSEWRPV